ncbi:hypothetical protein AAC387_Pa07g3604 [Persea americana]
MNGREREASSGASLVASGRCTFGRLPWQRHRKGDLRWKKGLKGGERRGHGVSAENGFKYPFQIALIYGVRWGVVEQQKAVLLWIMDTKSLPSLLHPNIRFPLLHKKRERIPQRRLLPNMASFDQHSNFTKTLCFCFYPICSGQKLKSNDTNYDFAKKTPLSHNCSFWGFYEGSCI